MAKEKDYFGIFYKISSAFGAAATQNTLLHLIVQSAVETMDAKAACLFLQDARKEFFVPMAQIGLSENYFHASPLNSKGMIGALERGGYLYFEDALTDKRLENHARKKAEGIASILTVPVRMANVTKGVLSLYTATQRKFDEKQIAFLCALANQGGVAIYTNNLLNRLKKNSMLFLELASNINSSLDIKEILNNLTENICDTLEMKGVDIRLLNEDTKTMELVASYGLSDEFLEMKRNIDTETTGRALKGETVIVSNTKTDERIVFKKEMEKEGIKSMIVTPILAREQVIGVMRLYSEDFTAFPSDILVMIEALANQGGLAIQNASMYLQLKEEKTSLEEDIWSHRAWF
ncbi:MAG: GAF domain-containing protein [Pseudomonadota bacterium]